MMSRSNRLAVIVGAGGLATTIAEHMGQAYRLLIADRDEAVLSHKVEELRKTGMSVDGQICDVTDQAAVNALALRAKALGGFQALAHVVGLSPSMGSWSNLLRVNLLGAFQIADAFEQIADAGAAAVFIASMAGHGASPTPEQRDLLDSPFQPDWENRLAATLTEPMSPETAYMLSKYAVIRLCYLRANIWGQCGARINSVSPGMIATPMGAEEFERQPEKRRLLELSPLPRQGEPEEVAKAVGFLLSEQASFITGTDLLVDGGVTAALTRLREQAVYRTPSQKECDH